MLYSPGTVAATDQASQAPATPDPVLSPPTSTPAPSPTTSAGSIDAKALMDAISADREAREARTKEQAEAQTYKKRLEDAEAKLNDIEKAKRNRLLDPAGYLRKLGYTDRDLALTSEGIMFSLMPDKAPAGHVANLVKAQREQDLEDQEAREKARESESQKREGETRTAKERELVSNYASWLHKDVSEFKPGTYPATQAWYADDHKGYAQELFAMSRHLADESVKTGKSVDISPAALASELEKKYTERGKRLAGIFSQSPTTTQPPRFAKVEATSTPEETHTTSQATGNHRLTEKEIIDRATKAAFGARS